MSISLSGSAGNLPRGRHYRRVGRFRGNILEAAGTHRLVAAAVGVVHLLHGFVDGLLHAERVGTLAGRVFLQALQVRRQKRRGGGWRP